MKVIVRQSALCGKMAAPPSKSAAHRAVIAAALADGQSVIENVDLSSDISATIGACKALGASIRIDRSGKYNTLHIDSGINSGSAIIDCAESGSTLRFMIPVACAFHGEKTFEGRGRLPLRPIDEYINIFEQQGIEYEKPELTYLPLTVTGRFSGGEYVIDGGVSSQYITGLLLALPVLDEDSTITVEGNLESKGYVDMTLGTLRSFGIDIPDKDNVYTIKGKQKYTPQNVTVEGDYSQAAFFIAGAVLGGDVTIEGLKSDSLQPDRAIIDIMKRMGADIEKTSETIRIKKSKLHGITVDVSQCPDLVPPIAAAAALSGGVTRLTGAGRLRIKESDRLHAISENLKGIGIDTQELPEELIITGGQAKAGSVDSFGDHRIAMAFSVIALNCENGIEINGAESIDKSYPQFFEDLKSLGGNVS